MMSRTCCRRGVKLAAVFVQYVSMPLIMTACTDRSISNGPVRSARSTQPAFEVAMRSRKDFATAFARVTEGMPADQAQAILGKPDDVRTQSDSGGISFTHTREIWGYGTDHHLGFATLGSVAIDDDNRVQFLSGTSGADELVAQLGEPELRRLLRLLAQTGGTTLSGYDFNPRCTIAAVNALHPLGKTAGVAVLNEYFRVSFNSRWGEDEGLILVMRALFEVPPLAAGHPQSQPASSDDPFVVVHPGFFRPPMLGAADWYPHDPGKFPLFPLVMVDDIPLLPVGGYTLLGHAESPDEHLRYLEQSATWRNGPLKPSSDPLGACTKLTALLASDQQKDEQIRPMIARQLLRLIDTVYREPPKDDDGPDPLSMDMAKFAGVVENVRALNIRWDQKSNCYVLGTGTVLPPLVTPVYRRSIFEPHFTGDDGCRVKVIVEREDPKCVSVTLELDAPKGVLPALQLRVIHPGKPEEALVDENTGARSSVTSTSGTESWSSTSYRAALAAGESVRVEVTKGDQHFVGPVVEP
jgi:hypothetical protein